MVLLQIWFSHRRRKEKTALQAAQAAAAAPSQAAVAPNPSPIPAALPKSSASSPVQQSAQTPLGQQLAAVQQARLARSSPPVHIGGPPLAHAAPSEGLAAHHQPIRAQPVLEAAAAVPTPQQLPRFIAQVGPFFPILQVLLEPGMLLSREM